MIYVFYTYVIYLYLSILILSSFLHHSHSFDWRSIFYPFRHIFIWKLLYLCFFRLIPHILHDHIVGINVCSRDANFFPKPSFHLKVESFSFFSLFQPSVINLWIMGDAKIQPLKMVNWKIKIWVNRLGSIVLKL